jgi:hypothetical protein
MNVSVPASGSSATDAISYEDLYARWERSNWQATAIDFTQDAIDWRERLTEQQRVSALWLYTLFFHGEDAVADNLSPYIDAAPLEEQKYFLATQQVDEARHAVFFHRFMHEVAGLGDSGSVASTLRATGPEITWGHRKVFSRLDRMAAELRADPSLDQLARAITLYHLVVEATLAQPGQHIIEQSLERLDVLPGFRAGMRNVALDEQRHIGFGVKLLADLYRERPAQTQKAIVSVLGETLGWSIVVPKPPNWDERYFTCWGFTFADIAEEGGRSLEQKLRAIGLPVDDLPGLPMDMSVSVTERGRRGIVMAKANYLGEGGPISRDPEAVEILFDAIAHSARGDQLPAGATIAWDFRDHAPWHVALDGRRATAHQGLPARRADATLRCSFEDWVNLSAGRLDARRLMLTRRLGLRGNPRTLLGLGRVFGVS